jgi:hypothetical protein
MVGKGEGFINASICVDTIMDNVSKRVIDMEMKKRVKPQASLYTIATEEMLVL